MKLWLSLLQLSMCQCSAEAWDLATSITRKNEARAAAAAAAPNGLRANSVRGSSGGGNPTSAGGGGGGPAVGAVGGLQGSDAAMKRVSSNNSIPRSSSSSSQMHRGSLPGPFEPGSGGSSFRGASPLGTSGAEASKLSFVGQTAPTSESLHEMSRFMWRPWPHEVKTLPSPLDSVPGCPRRIRSHSLTHGVLAPGQDLRRDVGPL